LIYVNFELKFYDFLPENYSGLEDAVLFFLKIGVHLSCILLGGSYLMGGAFYSIDGGLIGEEI